MTDGAYSTWHYVKQTSQPWCLKWAGILLLVLLRIPNPQPNPRILPESVRVRIREFFCGPKWRFWVVCSRVIGGAVQAKLRNCVWPAVRPCGRTDVPPPPLPAVWSVIPVKVRITLQLQIIIWSGRGGGGRPGGSAAGCAGWRVVLAVCSVLRCGRCHVAERRVRAWGCVVWRCPCPLTDSSYVVGLTRPLVACVVLHA